ncbi:MAG TPA: hypothetical protein VIC53_04340 [Wenzhouxiangella sp.]
MSSKHACVSEQKHWVGSVLAHLLFLSFLWLAVSVPTQAQLLVLVSEPDEESIWVGAVDSATGVLTKATATIDGCCEIYSGLTAVDRQQELLFAVGRFVSGDQQGQLALMTFSFDGESVVTVLPATTPNAWLAFDQSSGLLYSATFSADEGSGWFSLNPETGASMTLGEPDADCCEMFTGQAQVANLAEGRGVYFLARALEREAGDDRWHLWVTDLATGLSRQLIELPEGHPSFFRMDEKGEQALLMMQQTPSGAAVLYEVDLIDSITTTKASHAIDDCCWVGQGSVADLSANQRAWWLLGNGAEGASLDAGYFSLFANSNSRSQFHQSLPSAYQLHAMVINGQVLDRSGIFADQFQSAPE